jgi:hypothetical protein
MIETQDTLRALLLHRIPAAETAVLEDRILLDEDFAESLELERIDLLDDYAASRLGPADREAVERYLLVTPADRQRVALARALQARKHAPSSRRWILPAGAALAASLALLLVFPLQRSRTTGAVPASAATQARSTPATVDAPQTSAQTFGLTLLAETERGTAAQRIVIPAGTDVLHLQLEVPQTADKALDTARFGVVISAGADERFAASDLSSHVVGPYRIVEVDVPRAAAGTGSHAIVLRQVGSDPARGELFSWQVEFTAP